MSFANIFSHSVGCLLVLLIVSFAVQKLFISMRSQEFIFAFNFLALEMCQVRNCCGWGQRGFFLLSPVGFWWFPVSHSGLSSILSLFLCMVYSFILLHVAVQFSQHHLLKRLSFFHWMFFPALSKISWPYFCGSSSRVSILFHWSMCLFCANTMLSWWWQFCSRG